MLFVLCSGLPQLGIAAEQTGPLRTGGPLAEKLLPARRQRTPRPTDAEAESDRRPAPVGTAGNQPSQLSPGHSALQAGTASIAQSPPTTGINDVTLLLLSSTQRHRISFDSIIK